MVGPEKAQAEHAQSVIVGLDRLSKRAEHEVELNSVRAHRCVHKYASAHDEQLGDFSVTMVDRSADGCDKVSFASFPCLVQIEIGRASCRERV